MTGDIGSWLDAQTRQDSTPSPEVRLYEVGGCVRDELLGVRTKDIDYSVEIPSMVGRPIEEGFAVMRSYLKAQGYGIFVETPEFLTIRAYFPRSHARGNLTADFVLCRREGPYTDGRRPDHVYVGDLRDDLDRRDFTVNAMAKGMSGVVIDPHGGRADLKAMLLRCVGDPADRFREDALRVLRALRFCITKGFSMDDSLGAAIRDAATVEALGRISVDRRRDELMRCFQHDSIATMDMLHEVGSEIREAAMQGIKLNPTSRRRLPTRED